jgi:hypothetical protein
MDTEQPNMLDFVKAMSDAERLKIIGMLTQRPATAQEVAAELGVPFREAFNHLSFLQFVGVVRSDTAEYSQDSVYELNPERMEALAKARLSDSRKAYTPAPHLDEKTRKVLVTFLNPDGSIRQIPNSIRYPDRMRIILDYLIEAFTPGVTYTEKEVNTIIRRFNVDVSGLRRDLVDAGLLARERDGSKYWRPG